MEDNRHERKNTKTTIIVNALREALWEKHHWNNKRGEWPNEKQLRRWMRHGYAGAPRTIWYRHYEKVSSRKWVPRSSEWERGAPYFKHAMMNKKVLRPVNTNYMIQDRNGAVKNRSDGGMKEISIENPKLRCTIWTTPEQGTNENSDERRWCKRAWDKLGDSARPLLINNNQFTKKNSSPYNTCPGVKWVRKCKLWYYSVRREMSAIDINTILACLSTSRPKKRDYSSIYTFSGQLREASAMIIAIIITTEIRRWDPAMRRGERSW